MYVACSEPALEHDIAIKTTGKYIYVFVTSTAQITVRLALETCYKCLKCSIVNFILSMISIRWKLSKNSQKRIAFIILN